MADNTATPGQPGLWFGHPRQLARLFSTEMWERFGFYGMRALLTLYLAQHFLFNDGVVNPLYGAYTSLVYLTPFLGGMVADRVLGHKKAVKIGAILMSVGYLLLCFGGPKTEPYFSYQGTRYPVAVESQGGETARFVVDGADRYRITQRDDGSIVLEGVQAGRLPPIIPKGQYISDGQRNPFFVNLTFLALAMVIIGNGLFKPNISTMVGQIYTVGDPRRDAGYTIFYMGINLGSTASILLCPLVAQYWGWPAGFALAALGMAFSWYLVHYDGGLLKGYGDPPLEAPSWPLWRIIAAIVLTIPVAWLLMNNALTTAQAAQSVSFDNGFWFWFAGQPLLGQMLMGMFVIIVVGVPLYAWRFGTTAELHMMSVAIVLCVFNVIFFSLFEQAGSSLTLYADRNTQLDIGSWRIPAGQTQSFNAIFIVMFAPLLSALWVWLARRGLEPSTPVKFGLGLVLLGLGFLLLVWGGNFADASYRVPLIWLALAYLLHSLGELCLSPVGLSMISKLSMPRLVGMMMGVWFLCTAMGQYGAAIIAGFASSDTIGGTVLNPKLSLDTYNGIYQQFGLYTVYAGVGLLLLAPLLRRGMHGVK